MQETCYKTKNYNSQVDNGIFDKFWEIDKRYLKFRNYIYDIQLKYLKIMKTLPRGQEKDLKHEIHQRIFQYCGNVFSSKYHYKQLMFPNVWHV